MSTELKWVLPELDECQQRIEALRVRAHLNLALALAVGLLGIAVSGLQASDRPSAKRVVIGMGLTISALTFVTNQLYQGVSHQSLYAKCTAGDRLVRASRHDLSVSKTLAAGDPGLKSLSQVIEERLKKCDELDQPSESEVGAQAFRLTAAAYAAVLDSVRGGPQWINGRQSDERAVYFVGIAHGRDADVGRDESLKDARDLLRKYLIAQPSAAGVTDQAMADAVATRVCRAGSRRGVDTYVAFDQASGLVSYYTLLALDRRQLRRVLASVGSTDAPAVVGAARTLEAANVAIGRIRRSRQRSYACIRSNATAAAARRV
ncbi:MAG: hypothetical protein U0802_12950 [Candidatus Binatia bacterium]